jgi:saccharopine dehydrogenase-like NADP-dependent oxidoreductase
MRILMIGAGGVGDAAARIAVERDFFESFVVADHERARAEATVAAATGRRDGAGPFDGDRIAGGLRRGISERPDQAP